MNTDNQYAVWKDGDHYYYNPNCYAIRNSVGDVINGSECVYVGTLEECERIVVAHRHDETNLVGIPL